MFEAGPFTLACRNQMRWIAWAAHSGIVTQHEDAYADRILSCRPLIGSIESIMENRPNNEPVCLHVFNPAPCLFQVF